MLVAKLALFALLLVTAGLVLRRTLWVDWQRCSAPTDGLFSQLRARLGLAGVLYLAAIPLIVAFAAALRYVHVLAHGAETVAR